MPDFDVQARLSTARQRLDDVRPKIIDGLLPGPTGNAGHRVQAVLKSDKPIQATMEMARERIATLRSKIPLPSLGLLPGGSGAGGGKSGFGLGLLDNRGKDGPLGLGLLGKGGSFLPKGGILNNAPAGGHRVFAEQTDPKAGNFLEGEKPGLAPNDHRKFT